MKKMQIERKRYMESVNNLNVISQPYLNKKLLSSTMYLSLNMFLRYVKNILESPFFSSTYQHQKQKNTKVL